MKTEMKQETITVTRTYWTCYDPSHRHGSITTAEKCIRAHENKPMKQVNKWTIEMYCDVQGLRDKGLTFKEIGEKYNVTAARIKAVYEKKKRIDEFKRKKNLISG